MIVLVALLVTLAHLPGKHDQREHAQAHQRGPARTSAQRSASARKAAATRMRNTTPEQRRAAARKAAASRRRNTTPEQRRQIALKASITRRLRRRG